VVEDLQQFRVLKTYIQGQLVAQNGVSLIASSTLPVATPSPGSAGALMTASPVNQFNCNPRTPSDFAYPLDKWGEQENFEQVYVIEALDGQLITNRLVIPVAETLPYDGCLHSNPEKDLLKIVVVNRYQPAIPVAKSFIRNFGLTRGAIASSVAHDSHNIVAVGVDDDSLCRAVNLVIAQQGGLSCVDPGRTAPIPGISGPAVSPVPGPTVSPITGIPVTPPSAIELVLPLPVGGLMSMDDGYRVADAYTAIDRLSKDLGSKLSSPFMTLSFMALLVIPHLKLSDLGLFDGDKFTLL
jgi:adenine deaminase